MAVSRPANPDVDLGSLRVAGRLRAHTVLVYAAVAYAALSTVDAKLDSVPLKLFLVIPALALWFIAVRRERRLGDFAFCWPVLIAAAAVPVLWFAVALALRGAHDAAQRSTLHYAVQEASRFVYLLLYFPIADEMRRRSGWNAAGIWLWPLLVLAALTLALLVAGTVFGIDFGAAATAVPGGGVLGPIQGAIGTDSSGAFQVFVTTDILLLPGFAWLLADLLTKGPTRSSLVIAALLVSTAYIAHSRGIWIGVCVICAAAAFALWPPGRASRLRSGAVALASIAAVVLLLTTSDPALARSVVHWVAGRDPSTAARLQEAPQLLARIARDPVLGSGLGATLPSGYNRSGVAPWSFELAYLQLLFDLGIVGLLALAAPLVLAASRALTGLRASGARRDPRLLAALGACAALMITFASNPYLLTSAGMLAYAVVLALVETASSTAAARGAEPPRSKAHQDRAGPSQAAGGTATAPEPRPAGRGSFALLLLVAAVLGAVEFFGAQRAPVTVAVERIAPPAGGPVAPLRASLTLTKLPSGRLWLAAGWGRAGPPRVLIVADDGGRLSFVSESLSGSGRGTAGNGASTATASIPIGAAPAGTILGVSAGVWRGTSALFLVSRSGGRLWDEAIALDGTARVLAHGAVTSGPTSPGATCCAAVDIGPGGRVSLFILHLRGEGLSIAVRPGFPSPGAAIASIAGGHLPFAGAADTLPAVAAVDSRDADVALLSPAPVQRAGADGGAPAGAQLHVIASNRNFRTFGTQEALPVELPAAPSSIAIVHDGGAPVLVMLDARAHRLLAYGLWAGRLIR